MAKQPEFQHHLFPDNQDIDLIMWLENDSQSDLVNQAKKRQSERQEEPNPKNVVSLIHKKVIELINQWIETWKLNDLKKITGLVFSHFLARADDLHGEVFVTDELRKDSKITATVVSGATWINAMTNWPILYYAFNNWGTIVALTSTIVLDFLVLTWTNNTGTAAAGGNKGKLSWSWAGVMAFLLISTLQSIVAGVGAELINNQDELSKIKAGEIIDSYFAQLESDVDRRNSLYEEYKTQCKADSETLKAMPYGDPERNSLYLATKGKYGEEDKDWSNTPRDNIPTCPRASLLGEVVSARRDKLEQAKNNRHELGELGYLKNHLKQRYTETFTEEGQIKSGVIAVELAVNNFWQKLTVGDFEKLGFSIFFLSLSIITSFGALLMTVTYAITYNTKMSRNPRVEQAMRIWLHEVWCSYTERVARERNSSSPELKPYHGILLSLFIQEVRETGRCNYPVLQQIAEAAQQYPDYVLTIVQYRQLITELEQAYANICEAVIALSGQLSDIGNTLNTADIDLNKIDKKIESSLQENFQKISYGVHTLIKVSKKYYSLRSFNFLGVPISSFFERGYDNSAKDKTHKIWRAWQELNRQCNLNWILYGSEKNSSNSPSNSPAGSEAKKRCGQVKQQLCELPGYCVELYVETKDKIQDKMDEARLTPLNSSTPELPSGEEE